MKINKISRRAFLLGLGAVSTAALLSACGGSASSSSAASGSAAAAGSDVFRTLDEIKADGTVNIGVFSDKNPFGYVDENGEYQGYDVYFARRLAEDLGVEANFVSTEAANRIEYLQTGKVDIILANFTVTPERAEEVDFALPYMNVALGVISPDSNVITSLDNWNADDQMIVISGTTAETYLTKEYPDIPLQKYDSYATAKNALENGNGAAELRLHGGHPLSGQPGYHCPRCEQGQHHPAGLDQRRDQEPGRGELLPQGLRGDAGGYLRP